MATVPSGSKQPVCVPDNVTGNKVVHWKIHRRQLVNPSVSICELVDDTSDKIDIKAPGYGWVTKMKDEGTTVAPGCVLFNFLPCTHHVVMKDLCAECGANLRREGGISGERITDASASIPMVHAIPELHVSETVADEIALQDQQSLLAARKLVLLVDLDQTIIHTTNDPQAFKYKNVHRYRLPGSPLVYHTRLRPHLEKVLDCLSQYYQMHICTFGNRVYAHQLASMIDPKRRYFSQRILSRDEFFNPVTKSANLKALFPRGLNLVCIIDDRGEVWDWSPNLIHVKPYRFFPDIGDINAFPWSLQSSSSSSPSPLSSMPTSSLSSTTTTTTPTTTTTTTTSISSISTTTSTVTESSSVSQSNCSDVNLIDKSNEKSNSQLNSTNENQETIEMNSTNNDDNTTATTAGTRDIRTNEEPIGCTLDITNITTVNNNPVEICQLPSTQANMTIDLSDQPTANICDSTDNTTTNTTTNNNSTTIATIITDNEVQFTSTEEEINNDNDNNTNTNDLSSKIKEIELEMDAEDEDYLLRLQEILLRIHRNYFKTYDLWQAHHQQQRQTTTTTLMTKSQENKHSDHSINHSSTTMNNISRKNLFSSTNSSGAAVDTLSTYLPHVSDIIAKLRKTVLGPSCHITLSGLSPAHFPADQCLAGRIVRSLGGILHASLRLPSICDQSNGNADNNNLDNDTTTTTNNNNMSSNSSTPLSINSLDAKSHSHPLPAATSTTTTHHHHHHHYTTHLIACRRGTEKVHAALNYLKLNNNNSSSSNNNHNLPSHSSLHLISPKWLWSCHYHWNHVNESNYPLNQDYHPSDFDPAIEPIPGTIRYARRMRRHYQHHPDQQQQQQQHSSHNKNDDHRSRHHHRHGHRHRHHEHRAHHRHHHQHHHTHTHHTHKHHHQSIVLPNINDDIEQKIPPLDPSVVRSALDSIRTERENDRKKRKLKKRSKNKKSHKRSRHDADGDGEHEKNISLIDNVTTNDQTELLSGNESSSSSPSLKSDSSIESDHHQQPPNKQPTESPSSSSLSPSMDDDYTSHENVSSSVNSKLACLFNETLCDHHKEIDCFDSDTTTTNSENCNLCNFNKLINKNPIKPPDSCVTEIKDEGDQDFNEYPAVENFMEFDHHEHEHNDDGDDDNHNNNDDEAGGGGGERKEVREARENTRHYDGDTEKDDDDDDAEEEEEDEEYSDLINEQTEADIDDEEDDEEEVQVQLSDYLPPPTTLVLADNPLMHLPPDATSKMLAEIEDAVLEEVTEKATSVPREAELYDPAVDSFNDLSSTDSSSDNQTSMIELTKFHKSHISTNELPKNPIECDRKTLNWQVQRELLVRRRYRASPVETTKIDRKIHRLDQRFRRASRRRRSCDDLLIFEPIKPLNSNNDNFFNESDSDCDSYDADYPKGWGPDEQHVRKVSSRKHWLIDSHHHHKSLRLSVSPAIHSDPEPNMNWWIQQDTEDAETKEWNTCPEGYDYADAERTREILYNSRRDRYKSCKKYTRNNHNKKHTTYPNRGHGNLLTRCLFGADDNPEDVVNQSSSADDDDEDDEDVGDVIGPVSDVSIGEDSVELGNDDEDDDDDDEDLTD
ncbi:unnamed protein product [Schistosoma turkestanicum]|nr:unnamed protein product [Schistosoma turkestanicum]